MGWGSWFCEIIFKSLIGLSPIWSVCIYVGPVWHSKHVLRHFHLCSCIFHWNCSLLYGKCLTKCSNDILCCIGLKWVPMLGVTLDWTCLTCFGQRVYVLHTVPILCHAPPKHTLCITCCTHMHQLMHTHAQHMHNHLFSCILLMFTLFSTLNMLF